MISCLKQIYNHYDSLSVSEKLFADLTIKSPQSILDKPISEISGLLGISPSTIVGATKKLGFDGLRSYKLSLASEVFNPISQKENKEASVDNLNNNVLQWVSQMNCTALLEGMEALKQETFTQAAELLKSAQQIYIIGIGTSGILARELYDYLFRLGLSCMCVEEQHYQLLIAERARKTDAVIAISQSGVNRNIIEICEKIRTNGCKVVGLSNFIETPFAKYTDIYLAPFHSWTNLHENNFSFRIPMLCMIETLYYTLASVMDDAYQTAMKEHRAIVTKTALLKE